MCDCEKIPYVTLVYSGGPISQTSVAGGESESSCRGREGGAGRGESVAAREKESVAAREKEGVATSRGAGRNWTLGSLRRTTLIPALPCQRGDATQLTRRNTTRHDATRQNNTGHGASCVLACRSLLAAK